VVDNFENKNILEVHVQHQITNAKNTVTADVPEFSMGHTLGQNVYGLVNRNTITKSSALINTLMNKVSQ